MRGLGYSEIPDAGEPATPSWRKTGALALFVAVGCFAALHPSSPAVAAALSRVGATADHGVDRTARIAASDDAKAAAGKT